MDTCQVRGKGWSPVRFPDWHKCSLSQSQAQHPCAKEHYSSAANDGLDTQRLFPVLLQQFHCSRATTFHGRQVLFFYIDGDPIQIPQLNPVLSLNSFLNTCRSESRMEISEEVNKTQSLLMSFTRRQFCDNFMQ